MKFQKTLKIDAYKGKDGLPTCSRGVGSDNTCSLLSFQKLGTLPFCMYNPQVVLTRRTGKQGPGTGYITPCADCPIWNRKTDKL